VAAISRHFERPAVRPRRLMRPARRFCLMSAKTGSTIPWRREKLLADGEDQDPPTTGRNPRDRALLVGDQVRGGRRARSVLTACRNQLRLDPEVVLVAHLGQQLVARLDLDHLEGPKPDKAALRAWREFFARKWHERVED
jgi:hypothetical protein